MLGEALVIRIQLPRSKPVTGETIVKKYKGSFQVTKVFLNHSTVWSNASSWAFFTSGTIKLGRDAKPWVVPIEN